MSYDTWKTTDPQDSDPYADDLCAGCEQPLAFIPGHISALCPDCARTRCQDCGGETNLAALNGLPRCAVCEDKWRMDVADDVALYGDPDSWEF